MLHVATTYVFEGRFRRIVTLAAILIALLIPAMEIQATPGTGSAVITPSDAVSAGMTGTWTIRYTASEAFVSGVVEVTIPLDWTVPQIADPASGGYVTAATTGTQGSPFIEIIGRLIRVRIQSMSIGGTVDIVYGDVSGDPDGAATAQTSVQADVVFAVASNPLGSSPLFLSSGSPSVDVVPAAISQLVFTTPPRTFTAGGRAA